MVIVYSKCIVWRRWSRSKLLLAGHHVLWYQSHRQSRYACCTDIASEIRDNNRLGQRGAHEAVAWWVTRPAVNRICPKWSQLERVNLLHSQQYCSRVVGYYAAAFGSTGSTYIRDGRGPTLRRSHWWRQWWKRHCFLMMWRSTGPRATKTPCDLHHMCPPLICWSYYVWWSIADCNISGGRSSDRIKCMNIVFESKWSNSCALASTHSVESSPFMRQLYGVVRVGSTICRLPTVASVTWKTDRWYTLYWRYQWILVALDNSSAAWAVLF